MKSALFNSIVFAFIGIFLFNTSPLVFGQENVKSKNIEKIAEKTADSAKDKIVLEKTAVPAKKKKSFLKWFNQTYEKLLFWDASFGAFNLKNEKTGKFTEVSVPFLVVVLVFGSLFFTFWYRFINVRLFLHGINVVRGKYDNPNDKGEISHFKALTSALSATVGLGNIAGVAVAIQLGGPGAVFWMLLLAFFGMSAKFSSCTLAQLFRKNNEDGSVSGGPMYYLDLGLREKGGFFKPLGKTLAVIFAVLIMGGAIGGGNMFQANQSFSAFYDTVGKEKIVDKKKIDSQATIEINKHQKTIVESKKEKRLEQLKRKRWSWIYGLTFAVCVALVILGGIKRIGSATSKIVPLMCGIYVIASLFIIFSNFSEIPAALSKIFTMAFVGNAKYGGLVGVLVMGATRAAFSNEAGLGSASIAHAAAKTDEPVREGSVAMLGPFIDTMVICLMTALVVILTGAWNDPGIPQKAGVLMTTIAFGKGISWFPYVLTVCIILFAYSTMISWCYYGERGWIYLFDHFGKGIGLKSVIVFRIFFVFCVVVGSVEDFSSVLAFSDFMILSLAFPNILGSIILAPLVWKLTKDYLNRYKNGEMKTYAELAKSENLANENSDNEISK